MEIRVRLLVTGTMAKITTLVRKSGHAPALEAFHIFAVLAATVGEGETKGVSCVSACPLIYDKPQNTTARNASSERTPETRAATYPWCPQVSTGGRVCIRFRVY